MKESTDPQTCSEPRPVPPRLKDSHFMHQLSSITDHVYLTGVACVTQSHLLRAARITHVLNVAADECGHLTYADVSAEDGGIVVERAALRDSPDQALLPYLNDLVDFVTSAVNSGGRVVVHCLAGVSRSASVVIAYLMREQGMSLKDAHAFVLARRSVIRPNHGFWTELVEFEFQIRGENSVQIYGYASGSVPSLESYKDEAMKRMRLGWMDHVFYNLGAHACIFLTQMVASLWIFSDMC